MTTSDAKQKVEAKDGEKSAKHKLTKSQQRYLPIKRAIDILLSGGAIVMLSPVLGAVALAIKLDSPGPVLFNRYADLHQRFSATSGGYG